MSGKLKLNGRRKMYDCDDDIFEDELKCIRTSSKVSEAKRKKGSTPVTKKKTPKSKTKRAPRKKAVMRTRKIPLINIDDNRQETGNPSCELADSWSINPSIQKVTTSESKLTPCSSVFKTPTKMHRELVDASSSGRKQTRTPHKKKILITPKKSGKKDTSLSDSCTRLTPIKTSKTEAFCPSCQLPFRVLIQQSPSWHMTGCMSVSRTPLKECPLALDCCSELPSHYQMFRHQILASARAGLDISADYTKSDVIKTEYDVTLAENSLPLTSLEIRKSSHSGLSKNRKLDFGLTKETSSTKEGARSDSPSDIFASPDSENDLGDEPSERIAERLPELGTHNSKTVTADETESGVNLRITDVHTVAQQELDSQTSTVTEVEFLSETREESASSAKPASKKQQTLHSFFHLPDSLTAPQVQEKKKGRPAKNTVKKVEIPVDEETQKSTMRNCPFYKRIPGTKLTVDAFRYGSIPDCEAYFLSHFHYDHYAGLSKHFKHKIYCSNVTSNLVVRKIRVDESYVVRLPMNEEVFVNDVSVTLLDANHCPGAVMFLFKLKDGRTMLHTGDFRASEIMQSYPQLMGVRIHQLYLDTTYCKPQYAFPAQKDMIDLAVDIAQKALARNSRTLFVCGTYTIGKEKIFLALAEALNVRFCVTRDKKSILDCLDDDSINDRATLAWTDAQVHVLKMMQLKLPILTNHLKQYHDQYEQLVAFEPTGWTHSDQKMDVYKPKAQKGPVRIYGIPYSEHSSYVELKRFVQFLKPDRILPTVNNGSAAARQEMIDIFHEWTRENQGEEMEIRQLLE